MSILLSGANDTRGLVANDNKISYGCVLVSTDFHCDLVPNSFKSTVASGKFRKIYEVGSPLQMVQGKFNNAIDFKGYIGQYLTIPNTKSLNPLAFSISFWMKQDPVFGLDGSVLSHVNAENTAGWFFKAKVKPVAEIQFSVVNSQGKVFTTESPIRSGEFENVVGTFDGKFVSLYLNGTLKNSVQFSGTYNSDPAVPLNVGLNSYNLDMAWEGVIDDIRFLKGALSQSQVNNIFNGLPNSTDDLIGYWTFDNDTRDLSSNGNNGRIASQAVSMAFVPDGRLFFSEKNTGNIRIMNQDRVLIEPFVRVKDLYVAQHQGLLGITVDPKFVLNHYIYAFYTWKDNETGNIFNRVSRFTEFNNRAIEEKTLLDKIPASSEGEFAGGALAFGPDDKLFIASGHANSFELPQKRSSLLGKILRINRDGSIPPDNPFPNSPVFTLGHRNSYGLAFDMNGAGLETENGDAHYDEINLIHRGGNYGFPTTQPPGRSPQLDNSSSIKPVRSYWTDIAPTQAIFYYGNKFQSLEDKFLFGSYNEGSIYALGLNKSYALQDEMTIYFPELVENIISLAQSDTGRILFAGYNIYELLSVEPIEKEQQVYFIDLTTYHTEIGNVLIDPNRTSLTLSVMTNLGKGLHAPFLDVKIPKSLLTGIFRVSLSNANQNQTDNSIKSYNIRQEYRATDIGNTIVHIDLNSNIKKSIVIKGIKQNPIN